MKLLFHLLNLI